MNNREMLLSERLRQGALPVPEVMQCAAELADALRQIHDRGVVYGILEPVHVSLTPSGARLVYPDAGSAPHAGRALSPYTAPEQLQGKADPQSDVFAFGAVLYEMLSGRPAFSGDGSEALKAAILEQEPPPITVGAELAGALNRLVMSCLAKEPQRRWQRMQKVQMELKLLSTQARLSQGPAGRGRAEATLRTEIAELEKRLMARIDAVAGAIEPVAPLRAEIGEVEKRLQSRVKEVAGRIEPVAPLRAEIGEVEKRLQSRVKEVAGRIEPVAPLRAEIGELEKRLHARVEEVAGRIEPFAPLRGEMGEVEKRLQSRVEEVAGGIEPVAPLRAEIGEVEKRLQSRIEPLEGRVAEQGRSIESLQSAIAQTDDLVERVVDAFETFQESMLDQAEEKHGSIAVGQVS